MCRVAGNLGHHDRCADHDQLGRKTSRRTMSGAGGHGGGRLRRGVQLFAQSRSR